jgi:LemA protein
MLTLLLFIIGVALYFVYAYNTIVAKRESVINGKKEIGIQLDRRGKIFDSLINTVKKAMDYEKTTLKEVIKLREKIVKLDSDIDENEKKQLEEKLSEIVASGQLASSISMTMEAYPDLKANENMIVLQEEIITSENKLSYAKQAYNAALETYNALIESIPYNFIVSKFPKLKQDFGYWTIPDEKIKEEEERRVEF